jgi:glycerate kinase
MKILIVPDSFKGSMTTVEACEAIRDGILSVDHTLSAKICPLSDGGEGSLAILQFLGKGHTVQAASEDPYGDPIVADYVIDETGTSGWVELSQASGLWRTQPDYRNPMQTSTYGTGLLLKDAIQQGCTDLVLSVGGSATHDVGFGIAQALGVEFYDRDGSVASVLTLVYVMERSP